MTDLLVLGVFGQLGRAVERLAVDRGLQIVGHDMDTLDIRDAEAVDAVMLKHRPSAVINCAAFTAVDRCETEEEKATAINGTAVGHLAAACDRSASMLLHVSTDYVFSGDAGRPYTEADAVAPVSAYGRSKLLGEELAATAKRHLIVRTAWLYGHGGQNFVETIRRQIDQGNRSLRVVADQVGSPTFCDDLADALIDLSAANAGGIVHAVNAGVTSWHGFAVEIARILGVDVEVEAVSTAEFPRPAPRPAYSVLDTGRLERLIGRPLPPWQNALARYLEAPCES
jgi:dTDP-4-dehydrorhamnose reductase